MSFGFSNFGGNRGAPNNTGSSMGPALEKIQTEGIGFLAIAGSAKLRLVSQWSPAPSPTASLLTIAPRLGLVAAASPDAVVLASTEDIRKAFEAPPDGDSDIRSFQPQLTLSLPTRICQLAFTADESYLVLSAEQGGGIAAYDVQALKQGSTQPALQIPTNGESLRALVPNPQATTGELCAVVTSQGKLLIANMKDKSFAKGTNGQVLKEQVSCAAWSTRGKQLVAGLGDGTMVQMTPNGDVKAEIPRPSELNSTFHVSSVSWLENDVFFAFYVSTSEQPPAEACYLIKRQGQSFTFQKFDDPIAPFGSEKAPHQTVTRLKDFPPNLSDILIVGSTATEETGLLTRAKKSLASNAPADILDKIVDVFTTTELADDSRRATLPMGDGMDSPAPIGVALDLSSKSKVYKPIPADEIDESPGPLPGYWVLNDEGVLSIWWLVYNDSIREGTTYLGMSILEGNEAPTPSAVAPQQKATPKPAFGTSGFSSLSSQPVTTGSAFGSATTMGVKSSPWGTQNTSTSSAGASAPFGSSSFGSTPAASAPKFGAPSFGTAGGFGQAGGLGGKASPWATASAASVTPAFGKTGFGSATTAPTATGSAFGSTGGGSAFSGFAKQGGGFSSLSSAGAPAKANPFASTSTGNTATSTATPTSAFGSVGTKPAATPMNPFGSLGSKPVSSASSENPFGKKFELKSSFQPDPNAKDDNDTPEAPGTVKKTSMFGSNFGSALGETAKSPAAENPFGKPSPSPAQPAFGQRAAPDSTTPTSTPAPSKFFGSPAPSTNSLFGQPTSSSGYGNLFGSQTPKAPVPGITIENETPKPGNTGLGATSPPESTSKDTYPLGDSSSSSRTTADLSSTSKAPATSDKVSALSSFGNADSKKATPEQKKAPSSAEDAPLPPDPVKNKKAYDVDIPPLPENTGKPEKFDDAPLPPDPVRNKKAYDVVIPPLPGSKAPQDDAPLPPDPISQPKVYDVKFPTMPGAKTTQAPTSVLPTVSSASSSLFKFPTNPPPVSDSEEDDFSDEEEDDEGDVTVAASEGSGVDVAQDLSPESNGTGKTPGYTPSGSFEGLGSFSTVSKPDPGKRSLFGEVAPRLPRPPHPVSPRSPSPVRSAVPQRIIANDGARSVSSPIMASQILSGTRQSQQTQQPRMRQSIVGKAAPVEDEIMEHQRKARAKKEADENRLLVDEEDAAIQQLLVSEVEPTLEVSEFIAHSGVAPPAADSIPAQVEAVYRDINSMIDTLGLNARSLNGFIEGQMEFGHEERTKEDLSTPDNWTLDEIDGLNFVIESDLGEALEQARVKDVDTKMLQVSELKKDLVRDFNKQADLKKAIAARIDPDQTVANRALPLSSEQAAQQNDLRREYARFARQLAEAEESLMLLKAKIVSVNSASGKGGPTPTIEAVVRTITKMTSMVEKRSGDIDVLETQMRKMRLGSTGTSREGSPYAISTPKKSALASSMMFSPERSMRESTPLRGGSVMRHSISGSISGAAGFRTPPRKKLSGFGEAEKKALIEKRERRGAVLGKLRASIEKRGSHVVPMDHVA